MSKKAMTQTEYLEAVQQEILGDSDYSEDSFPKSDIKKCLQAAADVTIGNALRKNGCIVFGIGKLRLHKKPASKARKGRNPSSGEEIMISAKPAKIVPKFRLSKTCKDACLELVAEQNKKLQSQFKKSKKK